MDILRYFFNFLCFSTAFCMTLYWLIKYWKDEDLVQVDIKPLKEFPEAQFLTLSFCFRDAIIESKLKSYNDSLTKLEYLEILNGQRQNNEMIIDVDDVTLNIADFFLSSVGESRNGSVLDSTTPNSKEELPRVTFSSMKESKFGKCFGLSSKYTDVLSTTFVFNSSVFPNGVRSLSMLSAVFHLSNQFLIAEPNSVKKKWPKRTEKKEHSMNFIVNQIEILKRRNKRKDPCIKDDLKYDEVVLEKHLDKVGCKTSYQKTTQELKLCESKEKMEDASSPPKELKPCTTASTVAYEYHEEDIDAIGPDVFYVGLVFPKHFKEITMVKAIDIHSAIGNSGGYIGLFLGIRLNVIDTDDYFHAAPYLNFYNIIQFWIL